MWWRTYLANGVRGCQGAVKEIQWTWFLHNFGPRVATQFTEPIVAENDGLVLNLGICYDKISIWKEKENVL